MDSVPYDFIERTILLANPSDDRCNSSPFASLGGHWGRYATLLQNTTQYYDLDLNIHYSADLCIAFARNGSIPIEDALQIKHTTLRSITIDRSSDIPPEAEKIDDQKMEMLKRLLRRSNGLSWVYLRELPKGAPGLADLLEAIPRVLDVVFEPEVEDISTALSLVEKHAQRKCLKQLSSLEILQRNHFPLVRLFLKECEFSGFAVESVPEEEDYAKEMIQLIADNLKKRIARVQDVKVYGKPPLVDQLRKEMGSAISGPADDDLLNDRSIMVIVHSKDARQVEYQGAL